MDDDVDVLREVPDALQRLVRFTVRGFYGIEHGLAVDVLVRNACVKEEDIQELLKFDKKQLRAKLNQLKNDKFLKSRSYVVETQEDMKVTRHNYYYINYRSVANVIKYKLHHMHKRIETMERDETNRPSFKCPTCENTYSDLEVNQLIDPMFGTLNCTFCSTEVVEDKVAADQDSRTLQAKFNEQMEPVYKLLKEVENISLSDEVLEPKPTIIPHLHPNAPRISKSRAKTDETWSVGRSTGIDQQQDVVIDLGNEKRDEPVAKEVPVWMSESTVNRQVTQLTASTTSESKVKEVDTKAMNDEVMQTLLVQERSSRPSSVPYQHHQHHHGAAAHDVDEEESDEFEDVDEMVLVAGKPYSYEEVTRRGHELVNMMTSQEKANYIRIGQRLYEDMDE